ncbi:MAG: MobF family relaxase [Aeromicrobium sp.]
MSDAGTQAIIADAHHAAVKEMVDFMEREIAASRSGASTRRGAVAQVEVTGLIAAAYDHYDSRASDPHLHTHVVISNKVLAVHDGTWRSLDSRPLHSWTVALSELHQAVFADHLTRALGVTWEERERGRDRNPDWAVTGVPQSLARLFSGRSADIDVAADALIDDYVAEHGHRPSRATVSKIRNRASLATRPAKRVRSLADLTESWRARTTAELGRDATGWVRDVMNRPPQRLVRADDVPLPVITEIAQSVLTVVGEKRSTWRRANLYAEAARHTMGWRFVATNDREAITGMIVDAAEQASLRLTPPELALVPAAFTREDGTSRFRPRHSVVYTSETVLAAEDRLLERSEVRTGPTVSIGIVDDVAARPGRGRGLSPEQLRAVATIATDGRQVDLLVGPAGAGKTSTMRALHAVWTKQHGRGSVVGLAPSAAAAQVLASDLGIACENTAKWLHQHQHRRTAFTQGQLVIVDEATLAGTVTLDQLSAHAAEVGAKLLLVGDWAQLQSVEAGGAFAMLVQNRSDVPELVDIHRFTHPWERAASLDLRRGRGEAADAYLSHDRVREGSTEEMIDAAYRAWRADIAGGMSSVLIADSTHAVTDLNARARADRLANGEVDRGRSVALTDGVHASAGDLVITRRNDRRLRTLRSGWVRNGDRWVVAGVRPDGSLTVRRDGRRYAGAVVLPASYVAKHVDLGYAVTAHRAQGVTVDTAHVVAADRATRETFYVAMTRGRESNIAYVALEAGDDSHHQTAGAATTAREVIAGILQRSGAELSAHQTIAEEQEGWGSIAQLAAEYDTIAAEAQRNRWVAMLRASGLTAEQAHAATESAAFGPLGAELRRAEAVGHSVERLLPAAVARHGLEDADDIAAVLRHRIALAASRPRGRRTPEPQLIAGLIPAAVGPMTPEMRHALDERRDLIEQRAEALAIDAIRTRHPWVRHVGDKPTDARERAQWKRTIMTVAAYRARWGIASTRPLGDAPTTDVQRHDRAQAERAVRRIREAQRRAESMRPTRQEPGLGR